MDKHNLSNPEKNESDGAVAIKHQHPCIQTWHLGNGRFVTFQKAPSYLSNVARHQSLHVGEFLLHGSEITGNMQLVSCYGGMLLPNTLQTITV